MPVSSPEDVLQSTGTTVIHHRYETHEVYYVPYRSSLRDRLYQRLKNWPLLRKGTKILTVLSLISEHFSSRMIPHRHLYSFALKHLESHPDCTQLIVTGNPFDLFRFGYLLHKKTGVQWFADYRDDWNTSALVKKRSLLEKMLHSLSSRSEKKWVGTASAIFSVSDLYTEKISQFVGIKGYTVLNGYEIEERERERSENELTNGPEDFVITYNGSLYTTQSIEPFLRVIQRLQEDESIHTKIRLQFPGLGFDPAQEKRVLELTRGFADLVKITSRIPRQQVLEMQHNSDVLLMLAHSGIKGIPSSKLYEYIGLEKPIILFPNDQDIMANTLSETGLGLICENESALEKSIRMLIQKKTLGESLLTPSKAAIQSFSREAQTAQLAKLLHVFQQAL